MRHKYNRQIVAQRFAQHPESGKIYKLTLEVDADGLLNWLGHKAIRSKGGAAQECRGDVRVKAEPAKDKDE